MNRRVIKRSSSQAALFHADWPHLRDWYQKGARQLPWRMNPVDPYKIWISEVMSQQSTLVTVIPYFNKWLVTFPDLTALAKAPVDLVLKHWAGLGYYSRARNIHAAAQGLHLYIQNHGAWPSEPEEWLAFKGIGPYTAAAIASIAFQKKVLPLDGNVMRVFSRYYGIPDPLNRNGDRALIENILKEIPQPLSSHEMPALSQSLMELGALICKPKARALCEICPLQKNCVAYRDQKQGDWPLTKKRAAIEEILLISKLWGLNKNQFYLRQIPPGERLEGQWEFLNESVTCDKFEKFQKSTPFLGPVSHSITRYRYRVLGIIPKELTPSRDIIHKFGLKKVSLETIKSGKFHLSTLSVKLLKEVDKPLNQ